jgi:hypothetical protein
VASIVRLVVYTLLLGGLLVALGTFAETRERLQLQIALFLAMAVYMAFLIRQGRRVTLGVLPEVLYCLASVWVALASFLRLSAFH